MATAPASAKWSRTVAVPWTRLFSPSPATPPLLLLGRTCPAPACRRLYGMGSSSRPNAVVLGEAIAAEEVDLVVPSHDFSRDALVSSPEQVALYWEGNEPGQDGQLTYAQLLEKNLLDIAQAPSYPDAGRCWDIVDKYKVTIFYTAPTLVRALMRDGDEITPIPGADKDGYHWLTGRVDDVINVSGHRIGTAEVESALVSHPHCAEAAVVGVDHEVKGQSIYAFVTLVDGIPYSNEVRKSLILAVRSQIGAFAAPDKIHWAPGLPKTRSGKIMRRILRKIASRQLDELGDTSTLADPSVVDQLIEVSDR
ncbi:hypothetical protein BHM03_00043538 [Ensete ventricosum]|nr:hypothetical protein BHM03_00043538 [Ensete ventricosum]